MEYTLNDYRRDGILLAQCYTHQSDRVFHQYEFSSEWYLIDQPLRLGDIVTINFKDNIEVTKWDGSIYIIQKRKEWDFYYTMQEECEKVKYERCRWMSEHYITRRQ